MKAEKRGDDEKRKRERERERGGGGGRWGERRYMKEIEKVKNAIETG